MSQVQRSSPHQLDRQKKSGGDASLIKMDLRQRLIFRKVVLSVLLLICLSILRATGAPVKIMPLGDSITEGEGDDSNYVGYRAELWHLSAKKILV